MDETIRVLHVEDDAAFADLTKNYLNRIAPHFDIETVDSAEAGLEALSSESFDCIVSDYDMPGRNGIEFLNAVRCGDPMVPFVLFTGKGSEEIASEAIAAGVTDYIQKGGTETYRILVNRIENAVDQSRVKQFEAATSHDPFAFIERLSDPLISLNADWEFTYLNEPGAALFDHSPEELLGTVIWEEFPEAKETPFYDHYHDALEAGESTTVEAYFEPRDRWYREHIYPADDGITVITQDITERKRDEQQLDELSAFRQAVIAGASESIYVVDENEDIVLWNQAAADISGYTEAEVTGDDWDWSKLYPDTEYRNQVSEFVRRVRDGEEFEERYTTTIRTKSGDERVISWDFTTFTDESNEFDGAVVIGRDVTEEHKRRAEIQRLKDRYQSYIEHATDIITVLDENGIIRYQSRAIRRILGYGPEELVGDPVTEYIHPDDQERVMGKFFELIEHPEEIIEDVQYRFRHADGSWIWLESSGSNQRDTAIEGFVITSRDVTDRRQRVNELRERIKELEAIHYVVELFTTDDETIERKCTAAARELPQWFQFPAETGIRVSYGSFETASDGFNENAERITAESTTESGKSVTLAASCTTDRPAKDVFLDEEQALIDTICTVVRDGIERNEQNRRLEEFASVISHDLRGPLNAAMGRLTLVKEGNDSEDLNEIEQALERMDDLIEDVLRHARDGHATGEIDAVDLGECIEACWTTLRSRDAQLLIDDTVSAVMANEQRLRQLIENLLRNAIEHGGGDTTVMVGRLDSSQGFFIEDDGPGFEQADTDTIFERGYSTKDGGTGYGLAICQEIAAEHGWEIQAHNGDAGGARFEVHGVEFDGDG